MPTAIESRVTQEMTKPRLWRPVPGVPDDVPHGQAHADAVDRTEHGDEDPGEQPDRQPRDPSPGRHHHVQPRCEDGHDRRGAEDSRQAGDTFPLAHAGDCRGSAQLEEADSLCSERGGQQQRSDDMNEQREGIQGHRHSSAWSWSRRRVTLYSIHSVS